MASIRRVIDIRLNNISQLAGFAKRDDLRYFLKAICHIDYVHLLELAPTQRILDDYKKHKCDWNTYERQFIDLMATRQIEIKLPRDLFENACLLCSEDKPSHCHRRLVAEYLKKMWGGIEVEHII